MSNRSRLITSLPPKKTNRDLLDLETKETSGVPDSLFIVKPPKEKRQKRELKTTRVESDLLPKIQDFLSKVRSEEDRKPNSDPSTVGHSSTSDRSQSQVELNVLFYKKVKLESDKSGSSSSSDSDTDSDSDSDSSSSDE